MKTMFRLLSGLGATVAGGAFLLASLVLMLAGISLPADLAWATVVICGYPLVYLAVHKVLFNQGMSKISSALLISVAMAASAAIGELFAAGEIAFIMAIGAILEDKTAARAREGIRRLISLAPETGRRMAGGKEEFVPVDQLQKGDILRVLPGETVPVDGEIVSGETSLDQSVVTGEALPVDKGVGDEVFCGAINRFGSVDIAVTRVGKDSSLQKLIRLVQEAEANKAPMQRVVDQWATWLVPIALAIAAGTYLCTRDITRAVTVLVVFCPCALALATPTSIVAAIGQAARHGVIIKSGEALEKMGRVDVAAFDKTGTLTHGSLLVSDILPFGEALSADGLLRLAASAEARSEHPLGKAITACAADRGLSLWEAAEFHMIPGKGVRAVVEGKRLLCGNAALLADSGVAAGEREEAFLTRLRSQGKATILVAEEGALVGVLALSDTLRDSAGAMIRQLRQAGTQAVLLTGDHAQAAGYFAQQAGINAVHSQLLPQDKVERIRAMQGEGHIVCMIGDGVNDAPALKTADVGVAMSGIGSDIAIDAADIALTGDDISKIPYLKRLSNATLRLIKTNIALSMLINLAAIILSVVGLLGPISGALVHNAGSVAVVLNAALLYDRDYNRSA